MTVDFDLVNNQYDPAELAKQALANPAFLKELLDGISTDPKKEALRENCSRTLIWLAQRQPEALLPSWDYFRGLLNSTNGYSLYVAVYVLGDLSIIASSTQVGIILPSFIRLINDERVMVAGHTALNAGKIAVSHPSFLPGICKALLELGETRKGPHPGLVLSYVIQALDMIYLQSENRAEIYAFVRDQVNSDSPKTQKLAKIFVKQYSQVSS